MSKYYSVLFIFGRFHVLACHVKWNCSYKTQTVFTSESEDLTKYFLNNS